MAAVTVPFRTNIFIENGGRRTYLFLFFLLPAVVFAHPHQWINVVIDPVLDTKGRIIALDEQWSFDPVYAQMLLQPALEARDNAAQKAQMAKISEKMQQSLARKAHYTFSETVFNAAVQRHLDVDDGILHYRFRLPLATPTTALTYRIYEPTYFVEMRYDEARQKTRWQNACTLTIRESEPDPKMIAAAYAIDITGSGPDDLGAYFAQTSFLDCRAKKTRPD